MSFVANCIRFAAVQKFENRLRFDKDTDSLTVRTFFSGIAHNKLQSLAEAYEYKEL